MTRKRRELPTALEVVAGVDLQGRVSVVTGATSGIGIETARALAAAGSDLVLGARDIAAGERVAEEIRSATRREVLVRHVDLCDFASVDAFAASCCDAHAHIDVLVANAGASLTPERFQRDGIDVRFAGNHLGHFLLAHRLLPALSARGARLVVVSSAAHRGRPVQLDDLAWQARAHDMFAAYGESKTANILFVIEATRRWSDLGIFANAVLPGSILTGLQRHHGDAWLRKIGFLDADGVPNPELRTVEQGAATSVWAAVAPELAGRGGLVLEDCAEAKPHGPGMHAWTGMDPDVVDSETGRRLWSASIDLLGRCGFDVTARPEETRRR